METQVLYMQVLYVPLNIRYPDLREQAKSLGVTMEPYSITRVFTFYSPTESALRALRIRNILKPYKV